MNDPPRDVLGEMDALITAIIESPGDIMPPAAGAQLAARLRETDPDLLDGWLRVCAAAVLADAIRLRLRSARAAWLAQAGRRAFAEAAAAGGPFAAYRLRFLVADGSQRLLAEMTPADCAWLASNYTGRARALDTRAAFFGRLSVRMVTAGAATVAELGVSDAELAQQWADALAEVTS